MRTAGVCATGSAKGGSQAQDSLCAAKAGVIRTRSGETYKPPALRAYEQVLRARVLPELGQLRLSSLTRSCGLRLQSSPVESADGTDSEA